MSIPQEELHDFEKWVKEQVSEQFYKDIIEHWIHGIYNGFDHTHLPPDMTAMKIITKLHKKWKEGSPAIWITIAPDKLKNEYKFSKSQLRKVGEFCSQWFSPKRYNFYSYVIEVGKDPKNPFIHVHALVQIKHKKTVKNHARDLKNYWERKTCHRLKGDSYYSKNISGIYLDDKLQYMKNCAKGSHENFTPDPFTYYNVDGECRGQRGELI